MTLIKNYRILINLITSVTLSVFLISCNGQNNSDKALTEGLIEYEATVVDETHPMAGLAPSSASVKFKNNKFDLEMSTMGIFNTVFVSHPGRKTLTQMVKFMDIKNACIQNETDLIKENADYTLKLDETNETKKIAGYNCKKVKVTMANNPSIKFDVYYTQELGGDSINYLSPYRDIKGMLMQYRLKKLGLEMCFTAKKVESAEITDNTFEIPAYFKIINRSEMEKLFEDIQK